ncbi:MarR family transcriptional regulator [Microbacterium sp. STN6]|uniref:MarR family winged helix-turn-helix transcriptional regulator n=1 Tax=Microbacterium sp. STN6 TaxID=2995588 RepID=UPI002260D61E|nr:MarR family transcriptional regulator [Microbacterium sp. STN6]MCX7523290.1 MarR family transcriptional regulator [Microbacterium sp. STN6]
MSISIITSGGERMAQSSTVVQGDAQDIVDCDLAHEIEFLAVKAAANGTRRANQMLAPLGLKVRHYAVLSLACSSISPSQRMLADFLDLDPSQVVALVDELESRGLVRRVVDKKDRRTKVIRGTSRGEELCEKAAALTREAEEISLGPLSEAQREALRQILRSLVFGASEA